MCIILYQAFRGQVIDNHWPKWRYLSTIFIHNKVNNKLHLLHHTTPNYFTKLQRTTSTSPNYTISHLHQTTLHDFTPNHTARHYTKLQRLHLLHQTTTHYTKLHPLYQTTPNCTVLLYTKLFSCFPNFPRASNLNECSLSYEIIVKYVVYLC